MQQETCEKHGRVFPPQRVRIPDGRGIGGVSLDLGARFGYCAHSSPCLIALRRWESFLKAYVEVHLWP